MKRYYTLDFLKFAAAILIIFHHFQQSFKVKFSTFNFFGGSIYFGYVVELFFVLSGFFIAMRAEKYREESFSSFISKRAMRILPMAWISITAHALILVLYKIIVGENLSSIGLWKYIKSMLLLIDAGIIKYDENGFNNPLWYLGVLLICYVLFWFVNTCTLRERIGSYYIYAFLVLFGLGLTSYEVDFPLLNASTARGVVPFFAGCLLYGLYLRIGTEEKNQRLSAVFGFLIMFIVGMAYIISRKDFIDNLQMILIFAFYPALVIFALNSKIMNAVFNSSFFGELGKISFDMYIWHAPVFSFIKLLSAKELIKLPSSFTDMIVVTVIVTILATTSYYAIEKPLSKRLA